MSDALIQPGTGRGYDKRSWLEEADRHLRSSQFLRRIKKRRRTSCWNSADDSKPDHPLWRMENVIITPHVAGYAPRIPQRHLEVVLDNVGRFVRQEPLRNVVNKASWF